MKFTVFGAGAVGAFLGGKLALAGNDVTLIARGPHLAAMRDRGLTIKEEGTYLTSQPNITADIQGISDTECLILGVKAYSLSEIAPIIAPKLNPETLVVPAQNGIPWWYFFSHGGGFDGTRLESVDPGGLIENAIPSTQVIGCVVYPAVQLVEPGVVQHIEGDRFSLGELDGSISDRVRALSQAIVGTGLRAPIRSNIRQDIWVKLLGNLAFNPISALTRANMGEIATDRDVSRIVRAMMEEAFAVAEALNIKIPISIDQRILGAEKVGAHKTSMLQDIEAGKPTEIEALLGSVLELGRFTQIPMPFTSSIYACVKLLESVASKNT